MILKFEPEDFEVVELAEFALAPAGAHALYRLEKRGLGTLEALALVRRRWRIEPGCIAFGGLKDRMAVTSQHLTILGGPARDLEHPGLRLVHLGRTAEAFRSDRLLGNRFRLVIRRLERAAVAAMLAELPRLIEAGFANYFDEQRFGSVGRSGRYFAQALAEGDLEDALWLFLADHQPRASRAEQKLRERVRRAWGEPREVARLLAQGECAGAARRLGEPEPDLAAAVAALPRERVALAISAFQSRIWNLFLGHRLEDRGAARRDRFIDVLDTRLPAGRGGRDADEALPYPRAGLEIADRGLRTALERALADCGTMLATLRIARPEGLRFPAGSRAAIVRPRDCEAREIEDESRPGARALELRFVLPPGAYATMLVKHLAPAEPAGRRR